jgi:hypothetical protein
MRWFRKLLLSTDREIELIRASGLIDANWYRNQCVDVSNDDLAAHYVLHGASEGRSPHPLFDPAFYDLRRRFFRGLTPLAHFLLFGAARRLRPTPLFDTAYYLESNPQVARSKENPLLHYLRIGAAEGRNPHPLFASTWYREQYASLMAPSANPLVHYVTEGWKTRCSPHPLFDLAYLTRNGQEALPDSMSALEYFCTRQQFRNQSPTPLFDSNLYRFQVEVERRKKITEAPILHYLRRGYKDRQLRPNILFDPAFYADHNGLTPSGPELLHYVTEGDSLGFATHPHFDAGIYNANRTDERSQQTALEHFFQSPLEARHVSHMHMNRPISDKVLAVIDAIVSPDVAQISLHQRLNVDRPAGKDNESALRLARNVAGIRRVMRKQKIPVRDIPLGFYDDEYVMINPDLRNLSAQYLDLFLHCVQHARRENRVIAKWQLFIDLERYKAPTIECPPVLPTSPERKGICLLVHVYYPELVPEIFSYANNLRDHLQDVFINIVDEVWTPELHERVRTLCPSAFILISNNRGRDIGGFLRLLENIDTERYELFAFMHTKMSPHVIRDRADYWRRMLLNAFAGSKEIASESVEAFRTDKTIGLLGSKHWRGTDISQNAKNFEDLLDRFHIQGQNRQVEYVSGTMFLIRPQIVGRIFEVLRGTELEVGDSASLGFNVDGQLAHAIERVIGNVTRQMGYVIKWVES